MKAMLMHKYGLTKGEHLQEALRGYVGDLFDSTNAVASGIIERLSARLDEIARSDNLNPKGISEERRKAALAAYERLTDAYRASLAKIGKDLELAKQALPEAVEIGRGVVDPNTSPLGQADVALILDMIRRELREMDPLELVACLKAAANDADAQTLYALVRLSPFQRRRFVDDDTWMEVLKTYWEKASPESHARVETIETALALLKGNQNMAAAQIAQASGIEPKGIMQEDIIAIMARAKEPVLG